MKNWLRKIEDTMAAAAFAEEGEFEAAQQLAGEQGKILLALTGENTDMKAFKYAVNMSERIKADLEIICSRKGRDKLLAAFEPQLKERGISYKINAIDGCVKEEILTYTEMRTDILFVILESSEGQNLNCKKEQKVIENSWKGLKCPLVIVSDMATA
ncbi:MAG: universal stress protein [Nitrospiraceae bacterium]|nr:MAG: universal stress protein [Nitrospiraceae bacterium]